MQHKAHGSSLLRTFVTFLVAYTMIVSLMPTWAAAEDGSVNEVTDKTEEVADSENVSVTPSTDETTVEDTVTDDVEESDTDTKPVADDQDELANVSEGSELPEADEAPKAQESAAEESANATDEKSLQAEDTQDKDEIKSEATGGDVHVIYCGHVQNIGWMPDVKDGDMAGTQSKGLRVEALKIKLDLADSGLTGGIEYRMHVQNKGWINWARDYDLGGTFSQGLRVEAMQLRLYGEVADKYSVYYSVHAQNLGWMGWAKDGESAGTAGKAYRLEAIKIMLVPREGGTAPDSSFVNHANPFNGGSVLSVQSHVQNIGWQRAVGNGQVSGTTGRGLRVEALSVTAPGLDVPGSILLDGHVQDKGWTGWKQGTVGTAGKGKRLEAVKIMLDGQDAIDKYDIYYRVHVSNIGWLGWAKNGAEAGSSGMGARVEAIQVQLVNKGIVPDSTGSVTDETFITGANLSYSAHNQDVGWGSTVMGGAVAGVVGRAKRLEAFTMDLSGGTVGGSIRYRAYVAGEGWHDYVDAGEIAGTIGQGKGVEGIQIIVNGRASSMYDIYYRTHVSNAGWLGWACNGQTAGAPGTGRSVEAFQVRLISKGGNAPGSTDDHVVNKAWFEDAMLKKAQGYSSPTGWIIMVDTNKCQLGVYKGSQGHWSRSGKWTISCGAPSTPSVKGRYSVSGRGYAFGYGHGYTCYWWVSWNGPYLFHSIKYNEGTFDVQDGRLGKHISAGCIRMPIDRAKWIYDNIPDGTTVVTY